MPKEADVQRSYMLLADKPANKDQFGGAGHQRSARALAAAIMKLADEDGAIGLEGGWGSGKSTVVRFAEDVLADTHKSEGFRVFTFDLWAHGMHDIRRPLLEELVAWADHEKLLKNPKKNKNYFLEKIRDRNEVVTRKFSRKYSFAGLFALALAPLVPLALTWLSPFAFRNQAATTNSTDTDTLGSASPDIVSYFWIGALVIIALLYANFIIQAFRKGLSNAVSLYEAKSDVETEDRNIRRRDPATTEFQRIFRELLVEIQSKKCRLVLVLDNIDRIAESRLPDAWAEVRSVFAAHEPGAAEPRGSTAVTCVVPYDFQYVAATLAAKAPEETPEENFDRATALIRKTFKTVIRVAPPIGADWQVYFYDQLDAAIHPALDQAQKYRLFKMFEIYRRTAGHPTPRDIIAHINEIVLLGEQWGEEIPLEAMSLYIACRSRLSESPEAIIASDLVNEYALGIADIGSQWRKFVAALFYNVAPDHSERVMLEYRLNDALTSEVEVDFTKFVEMPNFGSALSDIVKQEALSWAKASPDLLDRVAQRIGKLGLNDYQANEIWRSLKAALASLKAAPAENYGSHDGLRTIVQRQPNADAISLAAEELARKYTASIPDSDDAEGWEGWDWYRAVSSILDAVKASHRHDLAVATARKIVFPGIVKVDLSAYACAGDPSEQVWPVKYFVRAPKTAAHVEALKSWAADDVESLGLVLQSKAPVVQQQLLVDVTQTLMARLRSEPITVKEPRIELVRAVTEAVIQIEKLTLVSDAITKFFNEGLGTWQIGAAIETGNSKTAAELIWLGARFRKGDIEFPQPSEVSGLGEMGSRSRTYLSKINDAESATELVGTIATLVHRKGQFSLWQSYALADRSSILKREVYNHLVETEQFGGLAGFSVPENFDGIREILSDPNLKKLVEWIAENASEPPESLSDEGSLSISPEFLRYVSSHDFTALEKYGQTIDSYLRSLEADDWQRSFEEDNEVLDRLILRIETAKFAPTAAPFKEAISTHLARLAKGEDISTLDQKRWGTVLQGVKPGSYGSLVKQIYSVLQSTAVTGAGAKRMAESVPQLIRDALETEGAGTIAEQVITRLVHADLELVDTILDGTQPRLESISSQQEAVLIEALEDAAQLDLSKDQLDALEKVSAKFKIALPEIHADEGTKDAANDADD